ncbi:MAG TPA: NAD-dependent epimerase/dehydratase family protein [Opitutaceae bacterium]|nr:NAD-dependent epimerase/dehydratase family protein [Opitutaceae bacterium]
MNVAILGANGFIGHRLFEVWQQRGPHVPRAVVRSPAGLARVARFAGEWRLADIRDATALTRALQGCQAVVHCVVGDPRDIRDTIDPVCRAAASAGVAKLVYLSSAAVHGQNPPPGTNEGSPLRTDHLLAYNNAKARAERRLQSLARRAPFETVILRPGIVFGARSRWVTDVADALAIGAAAWIDGGRGICNSIYVDNLVHAIECALATDGMRGEPFFVGDAELVTWRELCLGIAVGLGYDETAFTESTPAPRLRRTWSDRIDAVRGSRPAQRLIACFPDAPKTAVKAALAAWRKPSAIDPWALPSHSAPLASLEMSLLFACRTKLSHAKAAEQLRYAPPITFRIGIAQSVAWLRAVGGAAGRPPATRQT